MRQTLASSLLVRWVIAHTLSISIVSAATFSMTLDNYQSLVGLLILAAIISGLGIGGAEAWLLRPLLTQKAAGWWPFVMALVIPLGMMGGGFLGAILSLAVSPSGGGTPAQSFIGGGGFGFGIGALIGVAQWLFLRRIFHRAWIWMTAVTAGRTISWSIGMGLAQPLYEGSLSSIFLAAGLGGAIGGTVYGLITGYCLQWLMLNHKREDKAIQQETKG